MIGVRWKSVHVLYHSNDRMKSTREMSDDDLASPCGLYYGECLYYQQQCQGCVPSGGKPSWGKCRTYACTVEKDVGHCGECAEFPCELFLKQYSPELGKWRVFFKAGQLVYREKIGTAAWVKEKSNGKNPDPKVLIERYLLWERTQHKKSRPRETNCTRSEGSRFSIRDRPRVSRTR